MEFLHIAVADREYVAAEVGAFLLYWLPLLRRPFSQYSNAHVPLRTELGSAAMSPLGGGHWHAALLESPRLTSAARHSPCGQCGRHILPHILSPNAAPRGTGGRHGSTGSTWATSRTRLTLILAVVLHPGRMPLLMLICIKQDNEGLHENNCHHRR